MQEPTKCCSGCGAVKSHEAFARKSDSPDGRGGKCRECVATYMRGYNATRRRALRREGRERYARNPQRQKLQSRRTHLGKRAGFSQETNEFFPVLLADPCAYCGGRMTATGGIAPTTAALDHIDAAGDSRWSNLTGACTKCNTKKGRLPLLLFLLDQQLRRDAAPIAEQLMLIKGLTGRRRLEI